MRLLVPALIFIAGESLGCSVPLYAQAPAPADTVHTAEAATGAAVSDIQVEQLLEQLKKEQAEKAKFILLTWLLGIMSLLFLAYILFIQIVRNKQMAVLEAGVQAEPSFTPKVPRKAPSAMDDEELFSYIDAIIRRDKLYLDPMLSRHVLMKRIKGLSAHRIGAAFSKGSSFKSLPGYVRNLRMEYACNLLIARPDLSVKAVGEASGFSNNSTFCTDFKAFYGKTPSDFRKGKQSE